MEPGLGVVHRCRDFERIRRWAFQRSVDLGNRRQHVLESGQIADHTLGPNPEDDPALLNPPKWWSYNQQDL